MGTPKEKVDRLITLALGSSTPIEEARTAAMLACKLIQTHGLLSGLKYEIPDIDFIYHDEPVDSHLDALRKAKEEWERRHREAAPEAQAKKQYTTNYGATFNIDGLDGKAR